MSSVCRVFSFFIYIILASAWVSHVSSKDIKKIAERQTACFQDALGMQYTCNAGWSCCTGVLVADCIPTGTVCCDFGTWIGWCRSGNTCRVDLNNNAVCVNNNGITTKASLATTATTVVTSVKTTTQTDSVTTTTPRADSSTSTPGPSPTQNANNGGLGRGAIIGIAVSATCSVLGLIIGICIKVYYHRKEAEKNGQSGH